MTPLGGGVGQLRWWCAWATLRELRRAGTASARYRGLPLAELTQEQRQLRAPEMIVCSHDGKCGRPVSRQSSFRPTPFPALRPSTPPPPWSTRYCVGNTPWPSDNVPKRRIDVRLENERLTISSTCKVTVAVSNTLESAVYRLLHHCSSACSSSFGDSASVT
jgi:hypothetical protein